MSEALARVRHDLVLARPAKAAGADRGIVRSLLMRVFALPARFYLGAAFTALLAGIGVNALLLQRERRPAPFFAPPAPHRSTAGLNPAPSRAPAPMEAPPAASLQSTSPSPAPRPAAGGDVSARAGDTIGEWLREGSESRGDLSRTVAAAQGALAKLGYPVKADGREGTATDQALRDFERAHGLPLSTELTPRLMKQLLAAARAGR